MYIIESRGRICLEGVNWNQEIRCSQVESLPVEQKKEFLG